VEVRPRAVVGAGVLVIVLIVLTVLLVVASLPSH